jgi:CubicO group peptidase (beta-lactamase class C family)
MAPSADDLGPILASHVARWPGHSAAAVVARSGLAATAGQTEEVWPWASVTKLVVALACLVAVEEGSVALEDRCGPEGSTLAHLLAHASGLPFEGRHPVAPPARRRIYSNTGIEVAAAHLEARAGMPATEYLKTGVLEPLGMTGTVVEGSPARGGRGPLRDLLQLAGELLSPTLISGPTWQQAVGVAWPGLSGIVPGFGRQDPCDWGLGPEIRGHKSPHWTGATNSPATYGHFGQSGSFLWVDPSAGVALCGLGTTVFGPWAKQAWPDLSDAILARWAGPSGPGRPDSRSRPSRPPERPNRAAARETHISPGVKGS